MSDINAVISEAVGGFALLFNDNLDGAKNTLERQPDSPFHLLGLGITAFLKAALSQEEGELLEALNLLSKAEKASHSHMAKATNTVYTSGTEYRILVADASIGQALVHILTESYVEVMKAVYKLNKAYKGYGNAYKTVFPDGIKPSESLEEIVQKLNTNYAEKTSDAASSRSVRPTGLSRFLRRTPSSLSASSLKPPSVSSRNVSGASTASTRSVRSASSVSQGSANDVFAYPSPAALAATAALPDTFAWRNDPHTALVISGAAFGHGLFGLIFSSLAPRLRKLISYFGFSNNNRGVALKLLTLSALHNDEAHGYFASLALLTYYGFILLMVGWLADEPGVLAQAQLVVDRIERRFPRGTLWILNRAKLLRMRGDVASAIAVLEEATRTQSAFRQADSVLHFELAWCYLSDSQFVSAANSLTELRTLNAWSHATYVFLTIGALLDAPLVSRDTPRLTRLFAELPELFSHKRVLGEPPSAEIFIERKLASYHAKTERWIAAGRLPADAPVWASIRITPSMELGLFWSSHTRATREGAAKLIARLEALKPYPASVKGRLTVPAEGASVANGSTSAASEPKLTPGSNGTAAVSSSTNGTSDHIAATFAEEAAAQIAALPGYSPDEPDLDTFDEIATRDLLLGELYTCIKDYATAQRLFAGIVTGEHKIQSEKWIVPFTLLHQIVTSLKEASSRETDKKTWLAVLKSADDKLDVFFSKHTVYDLKGRLDTRGLMLREEIKNKREML